jgi:hypothetical protein
MANDDPVAETFMGKLNTIFTGVPSGTPAEEDTGSVETTDGGPAPVANQNEKFEERFSPAALLAEVEMFTV